LPYGAHTTASDALWMGLPIVTCIGRAFAGRVCASLCHHVGLDELVTETPADYERLAGNLAADPARLAVLRRRLEEGRSRHALFDIDRYTRGVEVAYATMVERLRAGDEPAPFAVPMEPS
jgi:predicted O-linked N-acetylglucosamine transferase (SPINDLY family)